MIGEPLIIACADKSLNVTHAQRAGKGPMEINALINGFDITPGIKFS